jgi:hypothetical protein
MRKSGSNSSSCCCFCCCCCYIPSFSTFPGHLDKKCAGACLPLSSFANSLHELVKTVNYGDNFYTKRDCTSLADI